LCARNDSQPMCQEGQRVHSDHMSNGQFRNHVQHSCGKWTSTHSSVYQQWLSCIAALYGDYTMTTRSCRGVAERACADAGSCTTARQSIISTAARLSPAVRHALRSARVRGAGVGLLVVGLAGTAIAGLPAALPLELSSALPPRGDGSEGFVLNGI